jgi:solute carrier family 25 protein 34/35
VGSTVQLASYDGIKVGLSRLTVFSGNKEVTELKESFKIHFTASMLTGLLVTFAMNPFDVIMTRLYNQPVGADGIGRFYAGPSDCLFKTIRSEGLRGLMKGFTAHWLRVGYVIFIIFSGIVIYLNADMRNVCNLQNPSCDRPHTVLTFVFLEQFRKLADVHWKM